MLHWSALQHAGLCSVGFSFFFPAVSKCPTKVCRTIDLFRWPPGLVIQGFGAECTGLNESVELGPEITCNCGCFAEFAPNADVFDTVMSCSYPLTRTHIHRKRVVPVCVRKLRPTVSFSKLFAVRVRDLRRLLRGAIRGLNAGLFSAENSVRHL